MEVQNYVVSMIVFSGFFLLAGLCLAVLSVNP